MRLFERIAAVVLTATLLFILGMPSVLVGWFKVEQDRIAATLCLQKEVPLNTCQGTCQMNKVLKTVEKSTDDSTVPDPNRIETKEIQMLLEQHNSVQHLITRTFSYDLDSEDILNGVKRNLFRPPCSFVQA